MQRMNFEFYKKSADYVKSVIKDEPEIAIILGSGHKDFASRITEAVSVDYRDIPNFLVSTVESHEGRLIYGKVRGRKVICMSG